MVFHKKLHKIQEKIFGYITFAAFLLYLVIFFGLSISAPKYLIWLDRFIRVYVCGFLIYRFNPFRENVQFTSLDQKIVFTAAMLLVTSTFLVRIFGEDVAKFLEHIDF